MFLWCLLFVSKAVETIVEKVKVRIEHTVEAASCSARIKPAIGTTPTHLTIDNDTASPWAMAFVAVFAGNTSLLSGNMSKESLDVATSRQVKDLLRTSLVGVPVSRLTSQSLCQSAFYIEISVARFVGQILGGPHYRGIHGMVHLSLWLLLVLMYLLLLLLVLMGLCKTLLQVHLLMVLRGRLLGVHGAAVGEYVCSGGEINVTQAGCVGGRVFVLHIGIGLSLAMGIGGQTGLHCDGGGGGGGVVFGPDPRVVKDARVGTGIEVFVIGLDVVFSGSSGGGGS